MQSLAIPVSFVVPPHDFEEFAQLPDACKSEVNYWLGAMAVVRGQRPLGNALKRAGAGMGLSGKTARNYYDAFFKSGDWRVFINRKKYFPVARQLSPAFIEFWKALCERNQRKCGPAYRELLRQWRAGLPIPGYAATPPAGPGGVPVGWSYENLIRHRPSDAELAAARIGRTAAARFKPPVFTTRAGLCVGQYYLFDDIWHDHLVHIDGQRRGLRPLEFHALDLASGNKFAWGLTAQLEDIETGRLTHLSGVQMRFLLASVVACTGYHPNGTTLVVENGTAAVSEELERLLYDLSGGLIKIERAGMQGAAAFAGQYAGRAKGNFKIKATLESLGNLIHNEFAALRGQIGSNQRLNGPEEAHHRDRHHDALCNALAALPPEHRAALRFNLVDMELFRAVAAEVYRRINARTDHNLEGWEACGNMCPEYRFNAETPWLPASQLLALPAPEQAAIAALIDANPALRRMRRMSPAEVFARGRGELVRFAPHQVALMLSADLRVERRVARGLFEFEDADVGPDVHRFLARTKAGMLREGERYATVLNPIDMSLHVFDARGRWLGQCERWESVRRDDTEALHRQMGRARAVEAELLYPVARRGAELTRRRIEDARHNAGVFRAAGAAPGRPATRATRQARNDASEERARIRGERTSVAELLVPALPEPDAPPNAPGDIAIADLF